MRLNPEHHPPLYHLLAQERYREMLQTLTPAQLAVVALKLDGMSEPEIAEALGLSRQGVHHRIMQARARLLHNPKLWADRPPPAWLLAAPIRKSQSKTARR